MMKRKNIAWLLVGVILALLAVFVIVWRTFVPHVVEYGKVVSWEELPVPRHSFEDIVVEGEIHAVLVTNYRYDDLYVEGKSSRKVWEKFSDRYSHVFLYTESHAKLPDSLLEAASRLKTSSGITKMLAEPDVWFIHGGLGNGVDVIVRYDPETGNYLANIRLEHGRSD